MMVIAVENAPPRLRGRLSLWLAEVRAGLYVGVYSRRTRERIWADTKALIGKGSAVITWSSPTEAGFAFEAVGANRREMIDVDGLTMVRFLPEREAWAMPAGRPPTPVSPELEERIAKALAKGLPVRTLKRSGRFGEVSEEKMRQIAKKRNIRRAHLHAPEWPPG